MEKLINVAKYIAGRYKAVYNQDIDEMKLHKLMYFAQRESLIQNDTFLFEGTFYGWKYGPVLKEIRNIYQQKNVFPVEGIEDIDISYLAIMDKIFKDYACKNSWSLSRLTHGELSWKNSRIGISENQISDNPINNEDIKKDAERIKSRRQRLSEMGL